MPFTQITPSAVHQSGAYPDSIRHITNGDPVNQTFLRNPMLDLEFRTDVLKDAYNDLVASTTAAFTDTNHAFAQHDHSGISGEPIIDFARVYENGDPDAWFNLAENGKWRILKHGDNLSDVIFEIDEAGTDGPSTIKFPGSAAMFAHVGAAASDLTTNPHDLKLTARFVLISSGCLVASSDGSFTLDTVATAGTLHAAPELNGLTPSDGAANEGVIVGAQTDSPSAANIVLVHDATTNDFILDGSDVVYGLLHNSGTQLAPVWQIYFYTSSGAYSFSTTPTLKLYAQFAYSLSTVPTVDPRAVLLAKKGIKVI